MFGINGLTVKIPKGEIPRILKVLFDNWAKLALLLLIAGFAFGGFHIRSKMIDFEKRAIKVHASARTK